MINEINNKYGALTVISAAGVDKHHKAQWLCRCECGKEVIVNGCNLRKGNTKSCGCGIHRKKEAETTEIGNRYGKLTVIDFAERTSYNKIKWKCKCDCGNEVNVQTGHLHSGTQISCGKCYKEPYNLINEVGNKYGKLTALEKIGSKNGEALWKCRCDCGNEVIVGGAHLRSGNTSSCGCLTSKGEYNITQILLKNKIKFVAQYTFNDLKFIDLLKFDFCLLSDNNEPIRLIEFDGP